MKKILIIGKGGQVSTNLIELLNASKDIEYLAIGQEELDLSKPNLVYEKLSALQIKPDVIINAAAYTAVDLAEDEREICNAVNNTSVAAIAKYASKIQAVLIHYSTDYVFDGSGNQPFAEDNRANLNPLNFYGISKLDGENAIIKSGCEYLVLRTSWVYNDLGKNFVKTILKLASEKDELKIIDDQIGSPTYAYDLAQATLKLATAPQIKSGIYHLVPPEQISWHQFANMIVEQGKRSGFPVKVQKVLPIATSEYPTKAKRPLNSRLSVAKIKRDYGIELPPISNSLQDCLEKLSP